MKTQANTVIIDLPDTQMQWVCRVVTWFLVLSVWLIFLLNYLDLLEKILADFNIAGKLNREGDKILLIVFPIVSLLISFVMQFLSRYPHICNYPLEVTPENAGRLYVVGKNLILYLNLGVALLFNLIFVLILSSVGRKEMAE